MTSLLTPAPASDRGRKKKCFRCGMVLPLALFYRHPMMLDGRLNKCKSCARADVAANRLKNLERIRAYDRQRAKAPRRRQRAAVVSRRWRRQYRERARAQGLIGNALRNGAAVRPMLCQRCCRNTKLEAHHPDYMQPLAVRWLCKPCHYVEDCERRKKAS